MFQSKKMVRQSIYLWQKTMRIAVVKKHAPLTALCKRLIVKRDIQMSKSVNAWLWKFPIANTLTAVAFITTTETEISFLTAKIF